MWFNKTNENQKLKDEKTILEDKIERLEDRVKVAREDLAETKHKQKMSDEDIKHMVKIAKEKDALTLQKKVMDVEAKKAEEVAAVKDQYRDKMEVRLQEEVKGIKEMYAQILERLPNVTARLKGDI